MSLEKYDMEEAFVGDQIFIRVVYLCKNCQERRTYSGSVELE
jgi:hypothetical protein